MRAIKLVVILAAMASTHDDAVAQSSGSMQDLGSFGGPDSIGRATNFDGSIVVGGSSYSFIGSAAFVWTESTGLQDLGTLGGGSAQAFDISTDGSTIVGVSQTQGGANRAFRWTAGTGMQDIGTLGGLSAAAHGVNADGSVLVGFATRTNGEIRAFRWTAATGMQDLGSLPNFDRMVQARAVSADGTVVVGFAENGSGQEQAFRWTAAGGMVNLGTLGQNDTRALDVSASGEVVVGYSRASNFIRAFRWTASTAMVDLGTLAGTSTSYSLAASVSSDGNVIAGESSTAAGPVRAFRWTAAGGMSSLGTLPSHRRDSSSYGISGDGEVVVGRSRDTQFVERTFRWGVGVQGTIGQSYCVSPANSTGAPGELSIMGSNAVSANFVKLSASSVPPFSFGFFLTSATQSSTFPVSNSAGRLCLGGSIGRFVAPGQIQQSNSNGVFELAIDLTALPGPNGPVAVSIGETWSFQAWHRDADPTPTSNFTDGESVTFP